MEGARLRQTCAESRAELRAAGIARRRRTVLKSSTNWPKREASRPRKKGRRQAVPSSVVSANWLPVEPMRSERPGEDGDGVRRIAQNCAELRGGAPAVLDIELHLLSHLHDALEALEHAEGQGVGGAQRVALHVEERLDHERGADAPRERLACLADHVEAVRDLARVEIPMRKG